MFKKISFSHSAPTILSEAQYNIELAVKHNFFSYIYFFNKKLNKGK